MMRPKVTLILTLMVAGFIACMAFPNLTIAKEPVKIGVVLPLSGGFEIYGNLGVRGAKMAVAEINAAGGVLDGRMLELMVEDNKTDPKTAVEKAKKLILKDKVVAVMGPVSSAARDAMTPVAVKYKTPLLYGIDYEGGVCNRYVFLYSAIPDHDMDKLVPYMGEQYGKSFYIFGYDYVWPHKMTEAIKRNAEKIDGKVVAVEYTPFGVKDYAPTIQKIAKSGADVLMLIVPGADGFTFIKQFTEFGLKDKIKIVALASDENYLKALTPEQSDGIFTALPFLASLDNPEAKDFVARQKKMFGKDTVVTWATCSHYGLVKLLAAAIKKSGGVDKEKIIDAMGDQTITVGNGPETMRASDHHVILNMLIGEFKDGKLEVKKNLGTIEPSNQCEGKKM
ncbi:substrate-binding protein [Desulfococcaceae bacterium HSG9]|nr:substrate-binding protein [Desulfococcaceae bacterium HSG9]